MRSGGGGAAGRVLSQRGGDVRGELMLSPLSCVKPSSDVQSFPEPPGSYTTLLLLLGWSLVVSPCVELSAMLML
jgi:hypothetical protein